MTKYIATLVLGLCLIGVYAALHPSNETINSEWMAETNAIADPPAASSEAGAGVETANLFTYPRQETIPVFINDIEVATYNEITAILTIHTYDPNCISISVKVIKSMAESGRICEVMGHQWQPGYDHYWDDTWTGRPLEICGLCGRERYQKITEEWIEIGK